MSKYIEKKGRRYRTQFTMSRQLWERHQEALLLAAELGITVSVAEDFEKWFSKLVEQIHTDLGKKKSELKPLAEDDENASV